MWNKYICTANIEETLSILNDYQGQVKIIAGGTDLMLELEKGLHLDKKVLVDISRIAGLDEIIRDEDGTVHIGPMATHNHCVRSAIIQKSAPLLAQACYSVGSPQIRNRGTVAGNLITASPANDTIGPLIALDAEVKIRSIQGERTVKLADFYTGVRRTVLQPNEIVVDISFMELSANQQSSFTKYALRKAQAISLVNASIIVTLSTNTIEHASVAFGAVTPKIIHAATVEQHLRGKEFSQPVIEEAARLAVQDISPIGDIRSSSDYRSNIASLLLKRGLEQIATGTGKSPVPANPVVLWGQVSPNHKKLTSKTEIEAGHGEIHTRINGIEYTFATGQHKSLLHLVRDEAGLPGSKEGCGEGECGACTMYLDGVAVMSCLVPAARADGAEITTIEAMSDGEKLHPVQEAFIQEGAVQCGYCTPGFIMSAVKLFEEKTTPDLDEIKMAITGNLCRCTGYYKIIKAIESVAER
jgi:xanthine dehydrogenase iron-sulfur cluster and FAD-binding subunit A